MHELEIKKRVITSIVRNGATCQLNATFWAWSIITPYSISAPPRSFSCYSPVLSVLAFAGAVVSIM